MVYTPTRTELSTIASKLNLPVIPTKDFLSALIDVYADFLDVEYEDIIRDIDAEYLTYEDENYITYIITGENRSINPLEDVYGYLHYDDGAVEVTVAITK